MKPGSFRLSLSRRRLISLVAVALALPAALLEMRLVDASLADAAVRSPADIPDDDELGSLRSHPAPVELVGSASAAPAALIGRWLAESIRNRDVIDNVETVIDITADGKVTGSGGCNRISGGATVGEARISFSPMISTKMTCAPAILNQEYEFLSALGDARLWRIDEQRDKLILVDAHGVTILRLLRM